MTVLPWALRGGSCIKDLARVGGVTPTGGGGGHYRDSHGAENLRDGPLEDPRWESAAACHLWGRPDPVQQPRSQLTRATDQCARPLICTALGLALHSDLWKHRKTGPTHDWEVSRQVMLR